MRPPAATAAAPLAMLVTFSVTSAFASSISSRISTVTRSETSLTAVAMLSGFTVLSGQGALRINRQ